MEKAVYSSRSQVCSRGDLEAAIGILEEYIKIGDKIDFIIPIHLGIEEAREQIRKTFILAAESMKGTLKASEGLRVLPEEYCHFFEKNRK